MTITLAKGSVFKYARDGSTLGDHAEHIYDLCKNPAICSRIQYELNLMRIQLLVCEHLEYCMITLPSNSFVSQVISAIVTSSPDSSQVNLDSLRWIGLSKLLEDIFEFADWVELDKEQTLVLRSRRTLETPVKVGGTKTKEHSSREWMNAEDEWLYESLIHAVDEQKTVG